MPQKSYQKPSYTKPIRKRKHYYYDEPEESEESDSYVTEIRRCPKKQKKENNIRNHKINKNVNFLHFCYL